MDTQMAVKHVTICWRKDPLSLACHLRRSNYVCREETWIFANGHWLDRPSAKIRYPLPRFDEPLDQLQAAESACTFWLLSVLLFATLLASTAHCDTFNKTFSAFTGIEDGLSLDGFVNVSSSNDYIVIIEASKDVIDALDIDVSDSVLELNYKDNSQITTDDDDYLQIFVPAASIWQFSQSGSGELEIDGAILASNQTLELSISGSGEVEFSNVNASDITVYQDGSADVYIEGIYDTVSLQSSGSSYTYLYGVQSGVALEATGSGELEVDGEGSNNEITGTATGSYSISYTAGTCSVTGTTSSDSPCTLLNDDDNE